jgi:hypothetical protein
MAVPEGIGFGVFLGKGDDFGFLSGSFGAMAALFGNGAVSWARVTVIDKAR